MQKIQKQSQTPPKPTSTPENAEQKAAAQEAAKLK